MITKTGKYITCLYCGKEFYVIKSRLKIAKFCSYSCGAKYYAIGSKKKNGIYIKCQVCDKRFYVSKSKISEARVKRGYFLKWNRKYCSETCRLKARKQGKYITCLKCKKRFYVIKSRLKIAKFCSYSCMNKYNAKFHLGKKHPRWTGLTTLYQLIRNDKLSGRWKNKVFRRDKYTCQKCGDNRGHNLIAHHIRLFKDILKEFVQEQNQCFAEKDKDLLFRLSLKYKPLWDIDNGITLCKRCHKSFHSMKTELSSNSQTFFQQTSPTPVTSFSN